MTFITRGPEFWGWSPSGLGIRFANQTGGMTRDTWSMVVNCIESGVRNFETLDKVFNLLEPPFSPV